MPKARFSSLDTAAIVSHLRSTILGYRISNVYDINPKTYLLKLAKSGEDDKKFVLIESGTRPMSKPGLLGLRPAGSPEASRSARPCHWLPRARASLGQSATCPRWHPGHTGFVVHTGTRPSGLLSRAPTKSAPSAARRTRGRSAPANEHTHTAYCG